MVSKIEQIDENTWQAPDVYGHAPVFHKYQNDHGFMGRARREDILNPPPKQIHWDVSKVFKDPENHQDATEEQMIRDAFALFGAAQGESYVDMRLDSVTNRGKFIWPAVLLLLLWLFTKTLMAVIGDYSWVFSAADWMIWSAIILCFAWDLFRRAQLPVRFHAKNQEVYVYYRRVLYRIPWDQCDISVQIAMYHTGMGNMRDGYDLVLWLDPKYAVNKKKSGRPRRLVLNHMDESHRDPYLYWEYVRRFMSGVPAYEGIMYGPTFITPHKKFILLLGFICLYPLLILGRTSDVALHIDYINPFKRRWPKEVDEWTGEKCNWH